MTALSIHLILSNPQTKSDMSSAKTITIKIDLSQCDADWVEHTKRLLRGVNGVESRSIDVENGVVIVSGRIDDPDKVIDNVKKSVKHVTYFSVHEDEDEDKDKDKDKEDRPRGPRPRRRVHFADDVFETSAARPTPRQSNNARGHRSENYDATNGDRNCGCRRKSHSNDHIRVYFADVPDFLDFDSMHNGNGHKHYPDTMGHFHGQIPHHQCENPYLYPGHFHGHVPHPLYENSHICPNMMGMGYFHGQIPQQQFENSYDFRLLFRRGCSPYGCVIM